jgi:hypothetical protein
MTKQQDNLIERLGMLHDWLEERGQRLHANTAFKAADQLEAYKAEIEGLRSDIREIEDRCHTQTRQHLLAICERALARTLIKQGGR